MDADHDWAREAYLSQDRPCTRCGRWPEECVCPCCAACGEREGQLGQCPCGAPVHPGECASEHYDCQHAEEEHAKFCPHEPPGHGLAECPREHACE